MGVSMDDDNKEVVGKEVKPVCGLIMPISACDGYLEQHWIDVKRIICEAMEPAYEVRMVSDADDAGIIQKRIVQNLYDNEVVICDVSSKNPNVMFELGLRLAFDKPTVVIKDDQTKYSFDTSPIEHMGYPRDLRYGLIVQFKEKLRAKVDGTYVAYKKNPAEYSTFLKSFGEYRVPKIDQKVVSSETFLAGAIEDLSSQMRSLRRDFRRRPLGGDGVGNFDSFDSMPRSVRKVHAAKVVREAIDEYLSLLGVSPERKYLIEEEKSEAISYLESLERVRQACGSPEVLRSLVDDIVLPF
jgi:hypothetical protein